MSDETTEDVTTDFDFSDEGLAKLGQADEPVEAPETPAEATPEVEADNPQAVAEIEADSPETVDPVTAATQRYEEAQKVIGRQGQELGELRKMVEQMQSQAQPEVEQSAFGSYDPSSPQELLEYAGEPEYAEYAFQWAAQNAPEYLPHVIAEVQAYDPATAEAMRMAAYAQMVQAQTAPVHQQFEQQTAQQQVASTVDSYGRTVEGWDTIKDEVAQILEEEPWLISEMTPEAVQRGLRAATRMAQQARQVAATHAQAEVKAQGQQIRQQSVVETGTAGSAPVVEDLDPGQQIANDILAQDQKRREVLGY